MSYYDFDKTQLKEVIPVHYSEKSGDYYVFHENKNIAVKGQYKFGHKVGVWREYYENQRIKREVIYPEDPFDFKTKPVITKEWDIDGRLLYDRNRFLSDLN
jgi:antitoxin component YwqK of YwqJK toxin-antitoxin module